MALRARLNQCARNPRYNGDGPPANDAKPFCLDGSNIMRRGRSYRIVGGLALAGAMIAILPLTILSGFNSKVSVLENLEHVVVLVRPREVSPWFEAVFPGQEDSTAKLARFPHSSGKNLIVEFPATMRIDEIDDVMRSGAKDGGPLLAMSPKAERLRFRDWITERNPIAVPYRYFLLFGLLLAFIAAFLALLRKASPNSSIQR